MMKWILSLVLLVACRGAAETVVQLRQLEPELGAALGFQIYRFEAQLGTDEVLVVYQREEEGDGRKLEIEHVLSGNQVQVSYQIVLVDSGAFHPSLRDTYILRLPGGDRSLEKQRLVNWGHCWKPPVAVDFQFAEAAGGKASVKFHWWATVESYEVVAKRWPDLRKPSSPGCASSSTRVVEP